VAGVSSLQRAEKYWPIAGLDQSRQRTLIVAVIIPERAEQRWRWIVEACQKKQICGKSGAASMSRLPLFDA
jgi:hypothetical protein